MTTTAPTAPNFLLDAIAGSLDVQPDQASALADLVAARYSEPQRFYHSLQHLSHLCTLLRQHRQTVNDPSTVLAAILFHDIVYNPRSLSNEEDSAKLWLETCDRYPGLSRHRDDVREYILATKAHELPEADCESDLQIFLDMDLAILGAPREDYGDYAVNIRREYVHVDVETYCQARAKFLRDLSERKLFKSTPFFETYEATAKENIRWECNILASRRLVSRPDYLTCSITRTLVPFSPLVHFEFTIECSARRDSRSLEVEFNVSGNLSDIAIDYDLNKYMWEQTCFEVFLSTPTDSKYWELNISSKGNWNIFKFTNYHERDDINTDSFRTSVSIAENGSNSLRISLCLPLLQLFTEDELCRDLLLNLSAVIESKTGELSYWSHHHTSSHPDFHNRSSFSITV